MQPHSFTLALPRETSFAEACQAGKDYLDNELRLRTYADYSCTRSGSHPTMSGMALFTYSYEA
jgi:hypothetical protein